MLLVSYSYLNIHELYFSSTFLYINDVFDGVNVQCYCEQMILLYIKY